MAGQTDDGLQLSESEYLGLLASIVEFSDDAIMSKTLDGIITSWNPAAERMYGFTAREMVGRHIKMLAHPSRADEMDRILDKIREGGRIEHYETVRLTKAGRELSISLSVSPIYNKHGDVIGASSVARDVTAQNQASQYARSLIEASVDPLVTISPEGKITDVNNATIKITGVERDHLIGTDFSDYFTEPEKARQGYQQVFAQGTVTDYPLTLRHRDGSFTDVVYNASVYTNAIGNVLGVFAAARDVTAQKHAEMVIKEQRAKERERLVELEQFQRLTVGRELKMIELKKEIRELRNIDVRETEISP